MFRRKKLIKDIEWIDIQFENCEVARVPRDAIGNFSASDIRKYISICSNAVIELHVADKVYLTVLKDRAGKIKSGFGPKHLDTDLISRTTLNTQDITNIYIHYNTGEEEQITVPWDGDDDYHNPAQKTTIEQDAYSKKGQEYLVIEIERNKQ